MHVVFDFAFSDFCVALKNKIILKLEATYVLVLEMISRGKFGETLDSPRELSGVGRNPRLAEERWERRGMEP